jgi:hypothetical protein
MILRFVCTGCNQPKHSGRACPCGSIVSKLAEGPAKRPSFGQRRAPVKKVNRDRRAMAHERDFSIQARLCRFSQCAVPRCTANPLTAKIDPDHATTRGAGGHDEDTWPLCSRHHGERHRIGLSSFELRHNVSAEVVVGRMRERVALHGQPTGEDCSLFPELDEKGVSRCGVCLSRLPDDATRTP